MASAPHSFRVLARRLGNPIGARRIAAADIFQLVRDYRAIGDDGRALIRSAMALAVDAERARLVRLAARGDR